MSFDTIGQARRSIHEGLLSSRSASSGRFPADQACRFNECTCQAMLSASDGAISSSTFLIRCPSWPTICKNKSLKPGSWLQWIVQQVSKHSVSMGIFRLSLQSTSGCVFAFINRTLQTPKHHRNRPSVCESRQHVLTCDDDN